LISKYRIPILIIIDSSCVFLAIYLSHFFLNPYHANLDLMIATSSIILLFSYLIYSWKLGLYKKAWRYASIEELFSILFVINGSILTVLAYQILFFQNVYERALIVAWMILIIFIGGIRFLWRYIRMYQFTLHPLRAKAYDANRKRTLILGAGNAGQLVGNQLKHHDELLPIAFLDDNKELHGLRINGLPVQGGLHILKDAVADLNIEHIIIAMPSAGKNRLSEIVNLAKSISNDVQILPMIEDIVTGHLTVNNIRNVSIEDLLGREPVKLDIQGISKELYNEVILVTGAGGSIGSELCRQLCHFKPKELILLGHGENSIYHIEMELLKLHKGIKFTTIIADIKDRERIFEVIDQYRPKFVYHAAAHKHVPLMEKNISEAVKNNIFGTRNVAEASEAYGVATFVLISSDKAVNPTNVMGSTKRFAELIIQNLAKKSKTKFVAVRFGNVLGSRGSVVPLFKKQIEAGGPITVTDPEMTRYFMTIPEASRLVIQASALAKGGEIFVLDMGEPVRILDLAKKLILLSGFSEEEIPIRFTGLRPGEKMFEELLNENEIKEQNIYPKIHVGSATPVSKEILFHFLNGFTYMSETEMKKYLLDVANGRKPVIEISHHKKLINT